MESQGFGLNIMLDYYGAYFAIRDGQQVLRRFATVRAQVERVSISNGYSGGVPKCDAWPTGKSPRRTHLRFCNEFDRLPVHLDHAHC